MITPLPGAIDQKPGSATLPFFGVQPAIVDGQGRELEGACEGILVIDDSWPGQMRTVYGDHQRFIDTYFKTYPGRYVTGDGARRDADGYYWITGRVDDVLNVAGHRLGTAEVESALVAHAKVAEAAVVGCPHEVKGQGIYAYVTLVADAEPTEELRKELIAWVRHEIGPIATPDFVQWAPGLPKTRSGKIMRRILRKIAAHEHDQLGDVSTLADPSVVEQLVHGRRAPQFEELRETFHSVDGNNDGRIVYAEFARLLVPLGAGLTEQDCRKAFAEIDTDHDGAISFDEFAVWWASP
jgi:acetyl-CoA synthetase